MILGFFGGFAFRVLAVRSLLVFVDLRNVLIVSAARFPALFPLVCLDFLALAFAYFPSAFLALPLASNHSLGFLLGFLTNFPDLKSLHRPDLVRLSIPP